MLFFSEPENPLRVLKLLLPQGELKNEIGFRQDNHNFTSKSAVPPWICSYSPDSSSMRSTAESADNARAPLAMSVSHVYITISRAPPRPVYPRYACLVP